MDRDVDILIIGAGPAGTSTALHLARRSPSVAARTLVIDKARHPRHKLCGGGLVNDVSTILGDLGLDLREVPRAAADVSHLHLAGRGVGVRLTDIAFHVVRRREFDAWLVARTRDAGVRVDEEVAVKSLSQGPDGVIVETSRGRIRARAVVGADGSKGITRRQIAGDHGATARLVEVMIPPPPRLDPPLPAADAVFEFEGIGAGVQGYFWSFPMEIDGRPMRNFGVYDSRVLDQRPSAGSLKKFLEEGLARQGVDLGACKVEGHPIHLFSRRSILSAPGILLAGDAAGADPLLGEGISPALGYGDLAAQALVDAFRSGDFTFADYTRRVHESALGRALRLRHAAARLIYGVRQRWFQRLVWWRLQPLLRAFVRTYVFGWARPQALPALPAASSTMSGRILEA